MEDTSMFAARERFRQHQARSRWVQNPQGEFPLPPGQRPPTEPLSMRSTPRLQHRQLAASHEQRPPTMHMPSAPERKLSELQNKALAKLSKNVGYKFVPKCRQQHRLVLADALTTIEKLSRATVLTKRPREMSEAEVKLRLGAAIPESYFLEVKAARLLSQGNELWSSTNELIMAASAYVEELTRTSERAIREEQETRLIREQEEQNRAASVISDALQTMENWCDAWLEGRLKDDDWDGFQTCLD